MLTDLDKACFECTEKSSVYIFISLSVNNQHVLQSISTLTEHIRYTQASQHPGWVHAMESEIQALRDNHTWDVVKLLEGKRALPCKWIYKVKHLLDGSIERLKARLVVGGIFKKKE